MVYFPEDFFGIYKGTLHISSEKGKQEVPMELHLFATDTIGAYTYTLVYGEGTSKQVRDYSLVEIDAEKGLFQVDENNGILLDTKILSNKLYTLFEVSGNLLTTFITFEKDHLIFEIVFAPTSKKNVTHGNDEANTEVISYPITTVQRAVLKKQ
ncbi:hypothetical protein C8D94_1011128 [Marinirhabdus gelatinilytica]|uniref:Uncharacterized protein n=2 Tax=Marinirhabdus gelatinilytica TaxID=1703343 RepID=A0A370QLJ5_9FLAO|nr:hypothetical protein C8D94_1011128 [Marinirhabdus gelatinilytica]